MKYDKMIAVNKAESEQKIKKAIRAIDDMGARGLPISVTELVRWTGLSRGFFYKNVQVRQKLEEAIKQPRRIDFYNAERVLVEEEDVRNARLALLTATAQVLRNGLALLGVSAPEKM